MAFNSNIHGLYFGGLGLAPGSPFSNTKLCLEEPTFDMELDGAVTNDPWAALPIAPGVLDLDMEDSNVVYHMTAPPAVDLSTSLLSSSPRTCPPVPRPLSLTLSPCHPKCSPPSNAIACDEDIHRGRSPGPAAFVCPPAPRLDGKELPGANSGPAPPMAGTRPSLQRGFSALGLELTSAPSVVPIAELSVWSPSRSPTHPFRYPMERRGKSDDLHDRISNWSTQVAAATSHTTPVHPASSRPWAETFALPSTTCHNMQRSRSSRSSERSELADQLDPWAARIGRARGRTLDMRTTGRSNHLSH
jgi:hypothetical protein